MFLASTPFPYETLSTTLSSTDPHDDHILDDEGLDLDITDNEGSDIDEIDADALMADADLSPEKICLPFPSALTEDQQQDPVVASLITKEIKLRQTQASDSLHQLRSCLGLKSALFRKYKAFGKSYNTRGHTWHLVKSVDANIRAHASHYRVAHHALCQLKAPSIIMAQFPELKPEDIKMSDDVMEENRVGQRSDHVSWIWRLHLGSHGSQGAWMKESKFKMLFLNMIT